MHKKKDLKWSLLIWQFLNIKSVNIINLYNLSYCILIRSTWHNVCKLEAALFISCRCKTQTWHGLCSDLALTCILGDRIRSGQQRCVAVHTWHYEYVSSDHFWSDFIDSFCWKKGCHRRVFSVFLCFFFQEVFKSLFTWSSTVFMFLAEISRKSCIYSI